MRMNTSQASMADWQALYRTAYNAVYIGEVCRTLTQSIPVFKKVNYYQLPTYHSLRAGQLVYICCLFVCLSTYRSQIRSVKTSKRLPV